jgi:hypothetical protein
MKHSIQKYMALRERVDKAKEASRRADKRYWGLRAQIQKVINETEWDGVVLDYKGVKYILVEEQSFSLKNYVVKELKEVQ